MSHHAPPHPDFPLEQTHFSATLAIVREERQKAEHDLGIENGNDRSIQVIDDGSDDAIVQQFVLLTKLRSLHQLRLSEKSPYFARLDFTPAEDEEQNVRHLTGLRAGERTSVYLGRWGVIKTPEYKICVADWRSPMANLYYSGQSGAVHYDAPDGPVHGELSLKRMFTVEDGALVSMQNTGVVGQEKYLTDALSQVTTARLREVVTTIQAEQNVVIRHDPYTPLFVQGIAGSGKTTIALHRIAWILYSLQKTLVPQQLLILAPNPLFLSYISRVLPDLGVNEVRQMTFVQLCGRLLGKRMPKLATLPRLEARLAMDKPQRDALDDILRRKGALALETDLERFVQHLETSLPPQADILFGKRVLVTAETVRDLFLRQFRHFPLYARVQEVRKVILAQLKKQSEGVADAIHRATEERLEGLLHSLPDGEVRREKVAALLQSRDERMEQLKAAQKDFLRAYDASWPSLDLLTVYSAFWQDMAARDTAFLPAWDATHPFMQKRQAAPEDLPALLWLGKRLYGFPRMDIRHVVIDEAQDVSPLQIKVLRDTFQHDAFTLVGDLWQGIYGDEGIRSWQELCEGIFEAAPQTASLSTSYRSTVEIMQFAFQSIARHPIPGLSLGKPVLRHGAAPEWTHISAERERIPAIAQVLCAWQTEGFFSMAVVVKQEAAAKALHKALVKECPSVRLVTRGDDAFEGGTLVMSAGLVKGLEFDCLLIVDADASVYPDERFYAKLFYVLCTRPLHRLHLVSLGDGTPLAQLSDLPSH